MMLYDEILNEKKFTVSIKKEKKKEIHSDGVIIPESAEVKSHWWDPDLGIDGRDSSQSSRIFHSPLFSSLPFLQKTKTKNLL